MSRPHFARTNASRILLFLSIVGTQSCSPSWSAPNDEMGDSGSGREGASARDASLPGEARGDSGAGRNEVPAHVDASVLDGPDGTPQGGAADGGRETPRSEADGSTTGEPVPTSQGPGVPSKGETCATNPCEHGGKCTDGAAGAKCDCQATGYSGAHCETNVDDCSPNPCMHAGKCTDAVNGFVCDCNGTGYSGASCQSAVDDCASNPCMHGGKCTDGMNSTSCDCADTGFSGAHCEMNVDDCSPNPCQNGATCTDGVNKFSCKCAPGFTGATCMTNVDDCAANPCQNGGRCSDLVNAFKCDCAVGFSGTRCEAKSCGNGVVDAGEECDDGNTISTDSCVSCKSAYCGDGVAHAGVEECDPGPSATRDCGTNCKVSKFYQPCAGKASCGGANLETCSSPLSVCTRLCSSAADCPQPAMGAAHCYSNFCVQTCPPASGQCGAGLTCSPGSVDIDSTLGNNWLCWNAAPP